MRPTHWLVLAVVAYDVPFTTAHAISFSCIWLALALFSASAWHSRRAQSPAT